MSDLENTRGVVNRTSEFEVENFDENAGSTCKSVEESAYLSAKFGKALSIISCVLMARFVRNSSKCGDCWVISCISGSTCKSVEE